MDLVASVCSSVRQSVNQMLLLVLVCVSVISGRMQIVARMRSVRSAFNFAYIFCTLPNWKYKKKAVESTSLWVRESKRWAILTLESESNQELNPILTNWSRNQNENQNRSLSHRVKMPYTKNLLRGTHEYTGTRESIYGRYQSPDNWSPSSSRGHY